MRLIISRTNNDSTLDFEVHDARWVTFSDKMKAFAWTRPGNKLGIYFSEEYVNRRFVNIFCISALENMHWQVK